MTNFDTLVQRLGEQLPTLELRFDEPMSGHTTFRVGGPAALMALPKREYDLVEAVRIARSLGVEPVFVGNGSNLLVDDKGLDAFVIKTGGLSDLRVDGAGGHLRAGSG